jgi:hypothetical protein
MKDHAKLFLTGFVQVILVVINTFQVAHNKYSGVFFVGFLISLVWSYNVKKIAFGSFTDRVIYSSGAAVGSLTGLFISNLIYS